MPRKSGVQEAKLSFAKRCPPSFAPFQHSASGPAANWLNPLRKCAVAAFMIFITGVTLGTLFQAALRSKSHRVCPRARGSAPRGYGAVPPCRHGSGDRWDMLRIVLVGFCLPSALALTFASLTLRSRFVGDSLLEGTGFEPLVPPCLGVASNARSVLRTVDGRWSHEIS
jgi:hypothetical protein